MAFAGAGSASATLLTCGTGSQCPEHTTIKSASEGKAVLDAPFGNVECESTVEGTTENSVGETVHGPISSLTFTNCGGDTVTVLEKGTLSIAAGGGEHNGELTSSGAKVTVIHLGVHCIYETSSTKIGKVTGSTTTGSNATLDISATIPRVGGTGGAFCGSSAPWTGSYKITSPNLIDVDTVSAITCVQLNKGEGDYTTESDCTATINKEPNLGSWERSIQ
ncbi:MAG: hypothetical protein ACTHO8_02280 [Solirubrobacterales bacterium]